MSNKVFNEEWMKAMLNNKDAPDDRSGQQGPQIDWVQYNKGFKKKVMFKLMPANMKEDNVFATIINTHWIRVGDKTYRFVCPEQTPHLKKSGCKCPICEAKRKLLAAGFKEEELCEQGKFGPIPVFDPKPTTNVKAVILKSDTKGDWDCSHISVLQQNGTYMATWLAQKYADSTMPNFTDIESSNPVIFSRQGEQGKWDREFSFQAWIPGPDVVAKLREENEQLTLPDLWKLPSDTDIMQMNQIMDDMIQDYLKARQTMNGTATENTINEQTLQPTPVVEQAPVFQTPGMSMGPAPVQQPQAQPVNVAYTTNPVQYGYTQVTNNVEQVKADNGWDDSIPF